MTRLSFGVSDEATATTLLEEMSVRSLSQSHDVLDDVSEEKPFGLVEEASQLFHIAAPSVVIEFSLFFIFPAAASVVGRYVGTTELAAFSLGSLVGNLTCLSIMEGALTAADTLMPRAFGMKQYDEVGRIAIRGTVVCILLLIPPVVPLCFYGSWILETLGQDPTVSVLAQEWIRIYFLGVPPTILFRIALRFLLAQHQTWPLVVSSLVPCIFLQPVLLHYLVPLAGLPGSALAIVLTQWAIAILLVTYLRIQPVHRPETWPGLSPRYLKEALRPGQLLHFLSLSVGGIFSMMEWWFFETMCFIAGSFGVVALCVHTIAYNLVPLLFMIPLGILIGLTVRMGHLIVEHPHHAKLLAAYSMAFTTSLGVTSACILYLGRHWIIHWFTNDPEVVNGALGIWGHLCYYIVLLYIFGISQAILRALGMQWRLAAIIAVCLYGVTLPAVIYFAVMRGGGLPALWTVLPICYFFMQVALAMGYITLDWNKHAGKIREAMRHTNVDANGLFSTEASPLLSTNVKLNSVGIYL
jgi:multidrug resistance protein, MATE family